MIKTVTFLILLPESYLKKSNAYLTLKFLDFKTEPSYKKNINYIILLYRRAPSPEKGNNVTFIQINIKY